MIEALRRLGIAARFVSGYIAHPRRSRPRLCRRRHTHAWVQVYLPSAGWIEFDPTNGIVGTRDLIRVAVARDPRQAIPLHGTYLGSADAFVGMEVASTCSRRMRRRRRSMEIKVGFEIAYAAAQPTPMVIMLSIHPSRRAISSAPRPSSPSPTCRSVSTATALAISAAGWWRRPAASPCAAARWCAIPACPTWWRRRAAAADRSTARRAAAVSDGEPLLRDRQADRHRLVAVRPYPAGLGAGAAIATSCTTTSPSATSTPIT